MKLWIRSQDKECLMQVNRIDINEDAVIFAEGFEIWLGAYKTKERALEILDEIQKYINNNCEFIERKTHTKMGTYTEKIETYVYEMPKE